MPWPLDYQDTLLLRLHLIKIVQPNYLVTGQCPILAGKIQRDRRVGGYFRHYGRGNTLSR